MKFHTDLVASVAAAALGLAALSGCASEAPEPADSPESRARLAQSIAALEIAGGSYEHTLDLGADLALGSSETALTDELGRALTDEERTRVRQVMREALAGILSTEAFSAAVVEAYADRFTAAELQAVTEFFASPAGSRLLAEQSGLSDAIGAAMESLVDENLERFVAAVDEGIAREFDGSAAEAAR